MLQIITQPNTDQRRIGQLLLLLALAVTSYLVFSKPGYGQPFNHFDKLGHLGAFFSLAALLQLATNWRPLTQLTLLLVYAAAIEIVQGQLPYRSADVADLIADMLGALSFHLLLLLLRRWQAS
ncbi:VanZ family protein [Ferrimonas balearica DSM 9799]|uniref:VanZ family protein n=1 Tax=Ferrimonas balearica (strain DSM 9799 / CCM 4581 / KCTC 23876 / PAT) TaxID=550540 RepID=E1STF8_FERBD|nr:VanZ family protein [Ferrimonas balearica]MBY6018088.1 VanZ family protein [Halomonas denitrificans]ADN75091.1 VanZ family protein [Ferrimonas balearica DSM 9799]MBW3137986.1 VanZ family protein [Ferrimonas balearica]MBW3164448.1 VanZ family protein [Ferrimonas balearica]MBY5978754.1 VanZ family protein [Ferrimonas balearica]